jgi:hypothetical protein
MTSRRQLVLGGGAAVAALATGVALWPTKKQRAAYPFVRRVGGGREPLWEVETERLVTVTEEDAARLERYLPALDDAVKAVETLEPRLTNAKVGELTPADRELLRGRWWQVFDPLLAIDEIKNRYRAWYGLDYLQQPLLHARAFALSFSALCGQADAGLRLLDALEGKPLLPTLFDEAMPTVGLPARTWSALRSRIARTRDLFYVPFGGEWYEHWIRPKLAGDTKLGALLAALEALRARAQRQVLTPSSRAFENQANVVKNELFVRWFPVQRDLAEWAGDTRFAKEARHLIDDAQLALFREKLVPGDVILERRNWYLSNVGLPGFWPHAALYVGTQAEILAALAGLPEVSRAYDGDLRAHFAKVAPKAWASLAEHDASGHECRVIEAVSEGVVASSLEHSCAADYVAALRPRLPALQRVRAIERALVFWGRPYDFKFDFATDDRLVCSELVIKAYEPQTAEDQGLRVPYVDLVGRRAVPPTSLARAFRDERGQEEPQFEFVYFLEGREHDKRAVVGDADAFAATVTRPKWDIVQP